MYGKTILTIMWLTPFLIAETNPFGGSTVLSSPQEASSLAGSIIQQTVHSGDEVIVDPELGSNGREYKADGADKTGKVGTAIAIATGTALMAQGVSMSMSVIPSVAAAGRILISKASLEFAQAGADAASSSKNREQKNLLTNKNEDAPGNQSTKDEIKQALNNPELDKLLTDKGISSDDFKERIANGEFQSADAVGKALGDPNGFSSEDAALGESLAQNTLGDIFKEVQGEALTKSVTLDDAVIPGDKESDGSSSENSIAFNEARLLEGARETRGADGEQSTDKQQPVRKVLSVSVAQGEGKPVRLESAVVTGAGEEAFNPQAFLSKWIGKEKAETFQKQNPGLVRTVLNGMGLLVPSSRRHIFQTAHQNFRSFRKWRNAYRAGFNVKTIQVAAAR